MAQTILSEWPEEVSGPHGPLRRQGRLKVDPKVHANPDFLWFDVLDHARKPWPLIQPYNAHHIRYHFLKLGGSHIDYRKGLQFAYAFKLSPR